MRFFWLVITAALCFGTASHAETTGRVVGIMDGDTVEVLTPSKELIRVRLSGIDTPEKKQAFGAVAKKALSDIAFDRTVVLIGEKKDRYGRLIAKLTVGDVDLNLTMVSQGLAWHYKKYEREQLPEDRILYANAEQKARDARMGLWRDAAPIPPWEFRKRPKP